MTLEENTSFCLCSVQKTLPCISSEPHNQPQGGLWRPAWLFRQQEWLTVELNKDRWESWALCLWIPNTACFLPWLRAPTASVNCPPVSKVWMFISLEAPREWSTWAPAAPGEGGTAQSCPASGALNWGALVLFPILLPVGPSSWGLSAHCQTHFNSSKAELEEAGPLW